MINADDTFFSFLFSLSPSVLDLEIRFLASSSHFALFLRALIARLKSRKDFEAVQAVLSVFISVHADALAGSDSPSNEDGVLVLNDGTGHGGADETLQTALRELLDAQVAETRVVGSLVRTSLGLIAWTRGVPVV